MKNLKLLFIIIVFLLVYDLKSQDWMNWDSLGNDVNFYKIQAKFNDYWGPKNIGHNTPKNEMGGWKAYKRWEWFWEQRVAPSGQFPPAGQLMQESLKWKARKENSKEKKQEINNWTNLGPFTSTGGYAGLGRINWVQEDPNYNGTTNKILWIGSPGGGLWKTDDDGANWESKFEGFGSMGISSIVIDPDDTNIIYIATGDGEVNDTYSIGVLKSTNGGGSWNTTGLNWSTTNNRTIRKIVMDPYDNDILYAATSNGIYKTINAGSTWTQVRASTRYYDIEFKPGSSDTLYASGSTEVVRTTNAGTNWTVLGGGLPTTGINRIELAVSPDNPNIVYALFGMSGGNNNNGFHSVYGSTDGGTNWTARATYSGGAPNLLGWDTDGGDTGGQAWYDLVLACSPADADLLFVGGVNCWKSTNGGTDWTLSSHWYGGGGVTAVHADHHYMGFAGTTSRLYNGNDGGIYRSSNNGSDWSWLGSGLPITQLYRLGSSKTNSARIICGAQDNGTKLIKSSNWSDVMGGDGMECIIDHSNADVMYGTVYYGALSKSVNAGSSFSQITISSTEKGGWVAPYVMHPTNSDIIFMGYKNIFKTTNGGTNWTTITSGWTSNLTVLHVAPSNPDYIYAGTGGSLKYSSNGGSTWTTITLPISQSNTYLAINEYDPVKLYATFSGYSSGNKVFYSEDAGTNWTNISGNLPNVPANTIVYQRSLDNRLYVGTDIGVFWIDDNETEWQDFNEGLPDTKITELEIHYGTGKIRAATYGRGVWESEITPSNEVDTPILAYPADNSTNFEFDTKLGWYKSNNATSYGVQISINSDMSNPLLSMTGITDTTFVIKDTLLAYNTKYYFRVNAKKDTIISDWSAIRNFKTQEFVLIPTQIQPTNNSSGIAMNTKIIWKKSSTSQSYGLQVSANSNMSNPIINVSGLTDSTWTISDTLFNYSTNYYWQVNAKRDTATSNWSNIWNFKVKANLEAPTLTFPSNNATGIKLTDTLKWSVVSGANNYNILLSTDQNFSEILTNQTSSNNQLYLGSFNLKLNTNYYWKVLSKVNDEIGEWSSVFKFTTRTISHNYCIPVTSTCDEYIGQVIFNTISKSTDCDSYSDYSDYITGITKGNTYSIKVTNPLPYTSDYVGVWFDWNQDNDFVDTGEFTQLTTSNYSVFTGNITIPTTALKGKTMMRVRLLYGETLTPCGNATYGEVEDYSVYLNAAVLATPTLTSPTNNSSNQNLSFNLTWGTVSGATSYTVQVSTASDFSSFIVNTSQSGNSYNLQNLNYISRYYWRVIANNTDTISNWSTVFNFKTLAKPVDLLSPDNNAINQTKNLQLKWYNNSGITKYQLQVSKFNDFSTNYLSTFTTDTTLNSSLNNSTLYYWRSRAIYNTDTSAWSSIRNLTVKDSLTVPVLATPTNNAINQKTKVLLDWNDVNFAEKYKLQISTSNTFASTVYDNWVSISEFSTTSLNLNYNIVYYWRVLAADFADTTTYSPTWQFTTKTNLTVSVLVSPTNNTTNQKTKFVLDWNNPSNVENYKLQISTTNTFATTVYNDWVSISEFNTTSLNLNYNTAYYWRVLAADFADTTAYTSTWQFTTKSNLTVPVLATPTNNAANQKTKVLLDWNDVNFAEKYKLQISTSNTFSTTVYNNWVSISEFNTTALNLNYNTAYYWRVLAVDFADTTAYTSTWQFTTKPNLTVPVLASPVNNAANQKTKLVLDWNDVSNAQNYKLQISASNTFSTTVYDNWVSISEFNTTALNLNYNTAYYWRVLAADFADTTAYTSTWHFTTKPNLTVPVLATPTNNATNQKTKLVLDWNDVSNAEKYKLQISTSNTFATTVYDNWVSISEFNTTALNLNYNTAYYWRVLAADFADTTAYTSTWQFTTKTRPTAPSLVSVHNNDEYVSLTPKLIWSEIPMADGYRLQVARDINFNSISIDATDLNDLFYNIEAGRLIQLTNYYWRTSVILDGDTSNWSSVWKFKTGIASGINKYSVSLSGEKSDNCNVVWTENNIDISSINTTNDDCGGAGNCNFVNSNDKLTLNNGRIKLNLVDLNPFVDSIKVFIKNSCGSNCTKAYLYSNNDKIDEASSQSNGIITLTLRNNFSYITDLYVSSCNAEVLELTIYTNGNYPEDVPSDWDYTENTGSHSIITVPTDVENIINSRKLAVGDAIGVFYTKDADLKCAGYSIFNGTELNITVWGDDPLTAEKDGFGTNEDYIFKLWDGQESKVIMARVKYSSGNPYFESDGHSVLSQIYGTDVMQSITINQGWNLNSSYIIPTNANISQVFDDIKDDIVIVKNSTGKVYIPATNTNTIGNWNYKEGYQIYASKAAVLKVNGIEAVPQNVPIYLNKGWSFIPYLRKFDANINSSLQTIEEYNNLVIVKNNSGQIYMPGGSNTIGKMKIGQAYQTYLKEKDTLIYAPNYVDRSSNDNSVEDYTAINLQTKIKPTGNSMIIQLFIPNSQSGDEIGAWNEKGILIGSSLIIDKKAVITLWGRDEFTNQIATAKANEKLTLKLLPYGSKELFNISTSAIRGLINQNSNSLTYIKDEVLILNAEINGLIRDVSLLNIYPNPTKDLLNVDIELNEKSYCDLGIFDLMGREIISIVKDNMNAGVYRFKINLHNYTNGTYNIRMNYNNTIINKQFVIVK